MELLNPTISVQNTEGHTWLVRWQQQLSQHEHIDVCMKVPKMPNATLVEVQARLIGQLQQYLQGHLPGGSETP